MSYIWTWTEAEDQGMGKNLNTGVAPRLVPLGEGSSYTSTFGGSKSIAQVDVVSDFPWTQSPKDGARNEVPWIMITEKLITANPMLNQLASNLAVAGNLVPDNLKEQVVAQVSQNLGEGTEQADVLQVFEGLKDSVTKNAEQSDGGQNHLFPYDNLYTTKNTGFVYRFPYFAGVGKSVSNNFGGQQAEDGVSGIASGIMDTVGNIAKGAAGVSKAPNFMEPGSYIEQSKFFAFSGRENTYSFSFPLDNTDKHEDIVRNWQLVYLLTYQNLPNRMSRDLIMPPCIYEAHIPGIWYSPYAYIQNMTVNFLGTRRVMTLQIPFYTKGDDGSAVAGTKPVQCIIPDVYEIQITMKELVGDAQNMAYTLIDGLIQTEENGGGD